MTAAARPAAPAMRAKDALTFGSLFSGIGGIDLGLERAGMVCRWQVEIDDYCRRVLAKHWPDVTRYSDIRELTGYELEWVDVFAGGFPCPPIALPGKHLGRDDERWLWPEYIRLVRMVRPRIVIVENVPGLLSANAGREMGEVVGDLAASGYDCEWECVPAAAVGAPHLRDRVFIVAHATGPRLAERCYVVKKTEELTSVERGGLSLYDADGPDGNEGRRASQEEGRYAVFAGGGVGKPEHSHHYDAEPGVGRMVDGVPARVDRLRALGNAVVPQVAEWIGRRIMAA